MENKVREALLKIEPVLKEVFSVMEAGADEVKPEVPATPEVTPPAEAQTVEPAATDSPEAAA